MDAGVGGAAFAKVRGDADHSAASFLRRGDRAAHFEHQSRSDGFDYDWRILFRTKSFSIQQPRGSSVRSSLLEYKRAFFHRLSTLLRCCGRHRIVCRSNLRVFAALGGNRSVPAAKFTAWSASLAGLRR